MDITTTVKGNVISVNYALNQEEIDVLKTLAETPFLELRRLGDNAEQEKIYSTLLMLEGKVPFFRDLPGAWHTTYEVTDKDGLAAFIKQLESEGV